MPAEYNPSFTDYDPKDCGQPMVDAVKALAELRDEDASEYVGRSLQQIFNLAEETYEDLPDFWKVWKEWHAPQPRPDMGDL